MRCRAYGIARGFEAWKERQEDVVALSVAEDGDVSPTGERADIARGASSPASERENGGTFPRFPLVACGDIAPPVATNGRPVGA